MKKKQPNRSRIILCRLTPEEYQQIEKRWKATTSRKLSDYLRKKLLDKKIVTTYRNTSLDDFMAEMIKLRSELNGLGNNFNQVVKKLHVLNQTQDFRNWLISYELEKKILFNKVDDIKKHINKIADLWLQ